LRAAPGPGCGRGLAFAGHGSAAALCEIPEVRPMNAQYEKLLDDMYKAWSDHDVEKVVGYYTDDCVYEDMAMGVVNRGKEALRQFIRDSYKALPDFRVVYTQRFASDSRAAGQWVITGTWNGLFEGVDCTGTKIRFTGLSL